MTLEVRVNDQIKVFEQLTEAEQYVAELVRRWFAGDDEQPLTITLTRQANKSPPTLSVHVADVMDLSEALG